MIGMIQAWLEPITEFATPVLFHSLWQGALIAVLLKATLTLIDEHKAPLRYVISGVALALIVAVPLVTGIYLNGDTNPTIAADPAGEQAALSAASLVMETGGDLGSAAVPSAEAGTTIWNFGSIDAYLIPLWLAGVLVLSLRHLGGWRRARRLRCNGTAAVSESWQQRFDALRTHLKIDRSVKLLRSTIVRVPCVVGWIRPVILLPVATLANLKISDIELILAHELAHIRRHDILINIVQTVLETLLFFNPAVWWVSHQIRIERERCCDDIAVAVAGDRIRYARALVSLEESRSGVTGFAVAASGVGLIARVRRIVGVSRPRGHLSTAGAAGLLVAVMLVVAGLAMITGSNAVSAYAETTFEESDTYNPGRDDIRGDWEIETHNRYAQVNIRLDRSWQTGFSIKRAELLKTIDATTTYFVMSRDAGTFYFKGEFIQDRDGDDLYGDGECYFRPNDDYVKQMAARGYDIDSDKDALKFAVHDVTLDFVDGLHALGYDDLTNEDLFKAHIHDVTPEYIKALQGLGYDDLRMEELVTMRIHDVDPEYIEELGQLGYRDLSTEELVKMQIHDVETDFIKEFAELGYSGLSPEELVTMSIHDVDGDFIRGFAEQGYSGLDPEELVEMSIHDVDPYLIKELAALGYKDLKQSQLVQMSIHDVTPATIRGFADVGYRDLGPSELVNMSIHDVDPRYIQELADLGLTNLAPSQLVEMQIHDVTPSFIRGFTELGYHDLDPDDLTKMSIHDVTPRYVRQLAELGYKDLPVEKLVKMQIHDVTAAYVRRMHDRGLTNLTADELIDLRIHGD
jgi:beta-lactamase regulating signal transducer with metallopeptidase domain